MGILILLLPLWDITCIHQN